MKRISVIICMLGILAVSTAVYGGSIDYLSNQSAEYFMTLNRNAAVDSADIANYNPAGTVFLPDNGLYLNASTQYLFKPYEQTFAGQKYEQDESSIIPNFFAVYKKDAWAAFLAVTVPGGGGELKWNNGNATTAGLILQTAAGAAGLGGGTGATTISNQNIKVNSDYVGITPGVAYKINDIISVSLAGRYIMSDRSASASAVFTMDAIGIVPGNETSVLVDSDFDYEAAGFGGIVGLDIRPIDNLTIAARYETSTRLDFEYEMNSRVATVTGPSPAINAGVSQSLLTQLAGLDKDDLKISYDLPAILGLGVQYAVTPELNIMSSYTYYYIKAANWEVAGDYHNGWEAGVGVTYQVIPTLKIGLGFLNTESGETERTPYVAENPHLDSQTYGFGFTYAALPDLDVTLAGSRTKYISDSNNDGTVYEADFRKEVNTVVVGAQYRFGI